MSSSMRGIRTSEIEVTHVSSHGVWLLADGQELFLSYDDFPWFIDAPIGKIINVERPSPGHFRWPELDIDIDIESIEHPEKFPLKAK
ncbi:MAG: DUF2442 domain-containing protein [Proteobacteria bacterium]|nr:DUF2442 domain-containing protein [Pseudomonadota bacterium]